MFILTRVKGDLSLTCDIVVKFVENIFKTSIKATLVVNIAQEIIAWNALQNEGGFCQCYKFGKYNSRARPLSIHKCDHQSFFASALYTNVRLTALPLHCMLLFFIVQALFIRNVFQHRYLLLQILRCVYETSLKTFESNIATR